MIAVIPVRFTATPAGDVWSATLLENWMRPLIPFSLGDYWFQSGHGLLVLDHTIYSPVVLDDPRIGKVGGNDVIRPALVNGCIDAATTQIRPDWNGTDILLLWFAQGTDAFGGGTYSVPLPDNGSKTIPVTVVDINSTFNVCCQELGHSLGFKHEIDRQGKEYASPYSCMSARTNALESLRAADSRLPDGANIQAPRDSFVGRPAQRLFSPTLPAVHLLTLPEFANSTYVRRVGPYQTKPVRIQLYAPNYRTRSQGGPLPIVAVLQSNKSDGRTFAVEFRPGGWGYESAVSSGSAGLAVHSVNPDGRIRYDGFAPLDDLKKMADWPCSEGDFSLRIDSVDKDHDFVWLSIFAEAKRRFPIRGVLLAGGFRTHAELLAMSHDDMRNTLIVELANRSAQSDYQRFDNDTLAGMGAALVFLREARIRTDDELRRMTAEDQRNTLIVELNQQTRLPVGHLQGFTTMELVLVGLGSNLAIQGIALDRRTSSFLRGILLGGRFRTQAELNRMSAEDHRNTLIVEMTTHSNQTNYQSYDNAQLEGVGAVMTLLRRARIRDDAGLKTMSADDQRNTLIVEIDKQTRKGRELQALGNIDLVLAALGIEPA